jgi:hypothetical protein
MICGKIFYIKIKKSDIKRKQNQIWKEGDI